MACHTRRPLTFTLMILNIIIATSEGKPGTNFASSAMTSDSSGTRSSNLIGTIPDSNYSPSSRMSGTSSGGTSGVGVGTATRSGGSSGSQTSGSSTLLTGNSLGGTSGIYTRTGPTGTQHVILTPSNSQQDPTVLGRFGSSSYPSGPSNYGSNYGPSAGTYVGRGPSSGAYAGAGGASSGAFAGPGGAFAGSHSDPDYYG